ncbi:hypothetical protein AALP_AA5G128200 [Arabis alpina]|uniref:STI1 domain-containing protein n=1 Tax=Arabis alpina TaxID=50452 RepID=A0A087GWQ6_ARAAL|nr:hypothetical protein AALP_AA5G128200 [Arabis alpina]
MPEKVIEKQGKYEKTVMEALKITTNWVVERNHEKEKMKKEIDNKEEEVKKLGHKLLTTKPARSAGEAPSDPNNQELLDGVRRCIQQINKSNRGDLTPEELKERQAKGCKTQNILTDPVMRQVLSDLQENPSAAQKHMQNPMVMNKIQKLISAGIVQMK